ncbi:hypothetical protein N2152v2_004468 [Parachlorella kessleri]
MATIRIQGKIDTSVDLLRALLQAFQHRPSTEPELALALHALLLKHLVDAAEVSLSQTSGPLPPAFTSLLHLSLVELPAALAAAASEGYVPSEPRQYLSLAVGLALAVFYRLVRAECFPEVVEVAGKVAGCCSVSSGIEESIVTDDNPSEVLPLLVSASCMLLLLASLEGVEAEV